MQRVRELEEENRAGRNRLALIIGEVIHSVMDKNQKLRLSCWRDWRCRAPRSAAWSDKVAVGVPALWYNWWPCFDYFGPAGGPSPASFNSIEVLVDFLKISIHRLRIPAGPIHWTRRRFNQCLCWQQDALVIRRGVEPWR
jgi:hypothetical protein